MNHYIGEESREDKESKKDQEETVLEESIVIPAFVEEDIEKEVKDSKESECAEENVKEENEFEEAPEYVQKSRVNKLDNQVVPYVVHIAGEFPA